MLINLISDTVTRPTPSMLAAMMQAEVGDDVFGTDPTVNRLEELAATMFGMEAALFCPSGTMTNQIAIKAHTQPLDEVICDESSHIFQYETAGYAFHSGVGVNLLHGNRGKITAEQIAKAIKPPYDWLPKSTLVVLENTCNKGGGTIYRSEEIAPITALCREKGLKLHLDGARIFNALVETNESPKTIGELFDSISVCLSKGLGCPVGSLLIGKKDFIQKARRLRKVFGGGMRQAGYLAAAGIYALQNNIERLKIDHLHARMIGDILARLPYVENIRPVETNIIIFDLKEETYTGEEFLLYLAQNNIKASLFAPQTVRLVTHLEITNEMLNHLKTVLRP